MAKIEMDKSHITYFALALVVLEILTFKIFDLQKAGQGREVILLELHHSLAKYQIYKCHIMPV